MSAHCILVVEDDPAALKAYTYELKRLGYEVSKAASLDTAFARLREQTFDLIVTDLLIPSGSGRIDASGYAGIELIRSVRAGSDFKTPPNVPVIVNSQWPYELTREDSTSLLGAILVD